jgi:hypothetical protein
MTVRNLGLISHSLAVHEFQIMAGSGPMLAFRKADVRHELCGEPG